jgi:hypothetical protein
MRGLRSTLALLAVLIGLGAYIYFVSWNEDAAGPSTEKRVFQSVDAADIQELTIRAESGDVTTVRKDGDAWTIVAPVQAPASASEISSVTSALTSLDVVRVIDEKPTHLPDTARPPPRLHIY